MKEEPNESEQRADGRFGANFWLLLNRLKAERMKEDVEKITADRVKVDGVCYIREEALQNPVTVHLNMLRGTIAMLSEEQIYHLFPHLNLKLESVDEAIDTP